jgi:hypothetical protein
MKIGTRHMGTFVLAAFGLGLLAPDVLANTGITVESVNDYSYYCGNHSCDTICNSEGDGFWNSMTAGGTGWTALVHYKDSSVYDTDFYDKDKSGYAYDNDTYNFDKSGNAISFVCLHGTCDDCTTTNCTSAANCATGQECMNNPPSAYSSRCANSSARRMVTSSSGSHHSNFVWYGGNNVKWGEDSNSGSWAGAGTNGGTNLVFMINSCGLKPYFWFELSPAFAGVHLIAEIMPVSNVATGNGCADAANYQYRGSDLASYALTNPYGSVTAAWFAVLDGTPQSGYGSCPDQNSNYTYGGGRGINGCGAHNVLSYDVTQTLANWHVDTEGWIGARLESNDATGNGYGRWAAHCNYDCATYNFTK